MRDLKRLLDDLYAVALMQLFRGLNRLVGERRLLGCFLPLE